LGADDIRTITHFVIFFLLLYFIQGLRLQQVLKKLFFIIWLELLVFAWFFWRLIYLQLLSFNWPKCSKWSWKWLHRHL